MRSLLLISTILFVPQTAFAQAALEVCRSLAQPSLVDTSSFSETRNIASQEFDLFCKKSGSFSERLSQKSSAFSASLTSVGKSFGLGSSGASGSAFTESEFEELCRIGSSRFVDEYSKSISSSVGSVLASIVSDCVGNVQASGSDVVFGTVEVSESGEFLHVEIDRKAANGSVELTFTGIDPEQQFTECRSGGVDAAGKVLANRLSLTCTVSPDVREQKSFRGSVVFDAADTDRQEFVAFRVTKPQFVRVAEVNELVASELARLPRVETGWLQCDVEEKPLMGPWKSRQVWDITFQTPFKNRPVVTAAMSMMEVNTSLTNQAWAISTTDVSESGAKVHLRASYVDDSFTRCSVVWTAVGN